MRAGRLLAGLALAVFVLVTTARPAAADPPGPTNDVSRITAVEPTSSAVDLDVIGGDAFLRVRVEPGHALIVLGYQDEPYVRIDADGAVFENRRSPAVALNQDRYGGADGGSTADTAGTAGTDPAAPPDWRRVGGGGTYVWHDHRIHWMIPTDPPQLGGAASGRIADWTVPLELDGERLEVSGELVRRAAPSWLAWLAVAAGAAVATAFAGWRWPTVGLAAALAAAGLLATVTSAVAELAIPAAAGRRYAPVVVPALATACAVAAIVGRRSRYAGALTLSAGAILVLWIGLRWGFLTHAVLPTSGGAGLQRAAVAAALGAVVGATLSGARVVLRPPPRPAPVRAG